MATGGQRGKRMTKTANLGRLSRDFHCCPATAEGEWHLLLNALLEPLSHDDGRAPRRFNLPQTP
jgi:hypothetical protein